MPGRVNESYKQRIKAFIAQQDGLPPLLQPVICGDFGENVHIRDVGLEKLHKGVFRLHIRLRGKARDGKRKRKWRVICKVMRGEQEATRTFNLMQQLWENGFAEQAADGIHIAEPLLAHETWGIVLMREIHGHKMRNLLERHQDPGILRVAARALAKLHRCAVQPPASIAVRQLMRPVICTHLAAAYPDLATKIRYINAHSPAVAATFDPVRPAPVHGDFHLGQLFHKGNRVWLLDVGGIKSGDPAIDVANLIVLLRHRHNPLDRIGELIQVFCSAYRELMGDEIMKRAPLYESLALLRRACKLFRLQEPDAAERIPVMVEQAYAAFKKVECEMTAPC